MEWLSENFLQYIKPIYVYKCIETVRFSWAVECKRVATAEKVPHKKNNNITRKIWMFKIQKNEEKKQ